MKEAGIRCLQASEHVLAGEFSLLPRKSLNFALTVK